MTARIIDLSTYRKDKQILVLSEEDAARRLKPLLPTTSLYTHKPPAIPQIAKGYDPFNEDWR